MSTKDNKARVERARNMLRDYVEKQLGEKYEESEDEIIDLVTDLRHLAADVSKEQEAEGYRIDFEEVIRMSEVNFDAETEDEEEDHVKP